MFNKRYLSRKIMTYFVIHFYSIMLGNYFILWYGTEPIETFSSNDTLFKYAENTWRSSKPEKNAVELFKIRENPK